MGSRTSIVRAALIAITCVLSLGFRALPVDAMTMAKVVSVEANLRELPQEGASISTTLHQGAIVGVEEIKGDWAHVMFFPNPADYSDVRRGWVGTRFLALVQGSGAGGTYRTSGGATFRLSVGSNDLDCDEGSEGYNSCKVRVQFSYDSDYNGSREPHPDIRCSVDIDANAHDGGSTSLTDDETASEYGRRGSGEVDIDFNFSSYQHIERVRVRDVQCEITGVTE